MIEGEVNHDRALEIGGGYTVEQIHPITLEEIIHNSGECYVLLQEVEPAIAARFVGRVLIIPPDQYNLLKTKAETK